MPRAKARGTLALRWRRPFDLLALAQPAALDIGFIRDMRLIDKEAFYRLLRLARANGGDHCGHPRFFSRDSGLSGAPCWQSVYRPSPPPATGGARAHH